MVSVTNGTDRLVRKAVVHAIELMGLKNPDKLEQVNQRSFIHTTTRGRRRLFTVYSKNEYFSLHSSNKEFQSKTLHKVMTFYITEEDL